MAFLGGHFQKIIKKIVDLTKLLHTLYATAILDAIRI